ncbi:MAG: murein hydrolase activator EnvC family protein [Alphaproteobacteria bacterium]
MRLAVAVAFVLAVGVADAPAAAAGVTAVDIRLESVERALAEGREIERRLESQAADLERELTVLRTKLVHAARGVQEAEQKRDALEARLVALTAEEAEKSAELARRQEELAATLGALERLGRQPPEALMAVPASVTDTVRTSLLLTAVVPSLDAKAKRLRAALGGLAELRRRITLEETKVAALRADLGADRRRIDSLLQRKAALQNTTLAERRREEKRVARLAAKARSLRELLDRLAAAAPPPAAEKPAPPEPLLTLPAAPATGTPGPSVSFSAARGTLPLPVNGQVARIFGQADGNGAHDKGITIETQPGAQVVTPYDGHVVFAGPFLGYGQLLIIEHGEGYHMLLAGFARIDSALGQWLLAGEPVGIMGSGNGGNPVLYVELRRNGEAINPLPWLAASAKKVNG